jgi:outer membrane biosynthesis protein TonB
MTSPKRAFLLGFTTLAVAGCQTIREELPTSASSNTSASSSNVTAIPVVVVPVPVPVPTTGPAPEPSNPTPSTPSNPTPNPTPRPPSGPANPNNSSATVRIGAKVYFIERNGQTLPEGSDAQVGDRIHFDATAKDAQNLPTTTQGAPHWTFLNQGIINVTSSPNDWTPVAIAKNGGTFQAYVEADGVRSNTVTVSIH